METKVILYDADGKKVGETFTRRARQLVKQQRAVWTDDSQSAVRFMADEEDWEAIESEAGAVPIFAAEAKDDDNNAALVALAQKRIHQRKLFLWHTLVFIPGFIVAYFFAIVLFGRGRGTDTVIAFMWGSWMTMYAIHAWFFIKDRLNSLGFHGGKGREARKARQLQREIALLKSNLGK